MAFTSYLISKFEYTHENLFFRKFSEELEKRYQEKEGEHILIGNISCNGHQMDAVYITRGQISVIDFKDYEGELIFSENNPWRMKKPDGEIIFVAGGVQIRNPFQQVRAYRFSLFQYLSDQQDQILSANRNDIKWDHTGCIVFFHNPIKFDTSTIPRNVSRYFHIADVNSIYTILDSRHSGNLELSDNEIRAVLKVLDVRSENLLKNFSFDENSEKEKSASAEKLALIKRLIQGSNSDPDLTKLLNYYRTLINVERFKEPSASDLHPFALDRSLEIQNYQIDIAASQEFHKIFLENLDQRFPKNLFVGLNICIDGIGYPLLHTIVLASDIKNRNNVVVNFNEFELYNKAFKQLGLAEDVVEELTTAVNQTELLNDKLECIREHLGVSAELTQTLQVGLSTESLFSSQLLSELRKLSEVEDSEIKNQLFKNFLSNKKVSDSINELKLEPFIQITPLNQSQEKAVKMSFKQPLTVVTGPPGTGKSQMVLNILANAIQNGHSVLFASKNNKAVDIVKDWLDERLKEPYVLRFGSKEELANNSKPTISKFINRKNQGQFKNVADNLISIASEINNDQQRIHYLNKELNKIPGLEQRIYKIQNSLDLAKNKKENWLKQLKQEHKQLFIDYDLELQLDKNQLGLLIHKIDKWNAGFFGKLLFNWFHNSKFQQEVNFINKSQSEKLYDYIQEQKPWVVPSEDILISTKKNLNFLLYLKDNEIKIKKQYKQLTEDISKLTFQFEQQKKVLEQLKNNKTSYENEIETINQKLPEKGLNCLNLKIEQKLYDVNTSALQHYLDYLPANNIWRYEEVTDFEQSCHKFLEDFHTVCVTSLSIKNAFILGQELFDILVIDEASQCDIGSALPLLYRAKRVVVIGDPLQLKHITSLQHYEEKYIIEGLGLEKYQLNYVGNSLWDFSYSLANKSTFDSVFLDEHYRSHPEIIQFSNDNFYERRLGQSLIVKTNDTQYQFSPKGLIWKHVRGEMDKEKNINIAEVNTCVDLANKLAIQFPEASIGIVTPFKHQYEIIFAKLPSNLKELVKVDTVHKFQGDEKDIIIFSTVVTDNSPSGKAYFLNKNDYLINVAITRARNTLFIVGNYQYCKKLKDGRIKTPLCLLAEYVEKLQKVELN